MSNDYRSEFITVAGATIHLWRVGRGQPLLFLHGLSGAGPPLAFYDALAKERTVIIPEHPGFGRSASPHWLVGIGDVAYFYLDLVAKLDLRGLDVVGHSLGGWIAAELAVRDASALRSLTLIAPAGVRIKGKPCGDFFLWSAEERAHNLFHDQDLAARILAETSEPALLETNLKNDYTAARLAWQPRFHNPELQRWLHRIRLPVQVVWGEQDRFLPVEYAQAWSDGLPNSRVATIAACGHCPQVEHPAETASIVRSHLREAGP